MRSVKKRLKKVKKKHWTLLFILLTISLIVAYFVFYKKAIGLIEYPTEGDVHTKFIFYDKTFNGDLHLEPESSLVYFVNDSNNEHIYLYIEEHRGNRTETKNMVIAPLTEQYLEFQGTGLVLATNKNRTSTSTVLIGNSILTSDITNKKMGIIIHNITDLLNKRSTSSINTALQRFDKLRRNDSFTNKNCGIIGRFIGQRVRDAYGRDAALSVNDTSCNKSFTAGVFSSTSTATNVKQLEQADKDVCGKLTKYRTLCESLIRNQNSTSSFSNTGK